MKDAVILSPSKYSQYTICVTELLIRNNINIKAIIVKKLFNPTRFIKEFRRDGYRLIKKIWKKLILRENAYTANNYETIIDFMIIENIHIKKIDEFKKYKIPIIYCNDLNSSKVINTLKKSKPNIVVFTGGGIIREKVLNNSGNGILNCHLGVLPKFRGMDLVEWCILENKIDEIGMTVHFMDKGVDTGDIISIKKIKIDSKKSINEILESFEPIMCKHMVQTCIKYLNGKYDKVAQLEKDGKQYFIMHPSLIKLAEKRLIKFYNTK